MPLPAGSFGASPLMRRRTRADEHAAPPAASEPGPCALTGNDPSSACAPHLRNAAPDSSCPALTKPTAVRSSHLLQQPSHELVITLDPEPLALRSTRNRPRRAMHQGWVRSRQRRRGGKRRGGGRHRQAVSGPGALLHPRAGHRPRSVPVRHGESPGWWYGAGATTLGLQGEASVAEFEAMFEGRNPRTGELLGRPHGHNAVPAPWTHRERGGTSRAAGRLARTGGPGSGRRPTGRPGRCTRRYSPRFGP